MQHRVKNAASDSDLERIPHECGGAVLATRAGNGTHLVLSRSVRNDVKTLLGPSLVGTKDCRRFDGVWPLSTASRFVPPIRMSQRPFCKAGVRFATFFKVTTAAAIIIILNVRAVNLA